MKMRLLFAPLALLAAMLLPTAGFADDWESLFDGKTLKNWDGDPDFWRVEDGCITGQTTPEKPTKVNTFLIYRGAEFGDFELTLDYKIVAGNSGIQYRSFEVPDNKWVIGGYQADIDSGDAHSGINYGERFRGVLANRGLKTVIQDNHKSKTVEQFADAAELQKQIKKEDWNSYRIVAKDFTFTHYINGVKMSECTDEDTEMRRKTGLLGFQVHVGPPMTVQFKNIKIRKLAPAATSSVEKKQVLLLAGRRSHGFGAHDHTSGCHLLAKLVNESGLPIQASVHELEKEGWPSAEKLASADTVVIYADGGGGHPFNTHLDELQQLTDKGTGIVCIHYGVETVTGPPGDAFLKWTGGFFEPHYSVNPHWTANYESFPKHPITAGVEPFEINDEWYYHMRFREGMEGVTPLLTDLPPATTLVEVDGDGKPVMVEENGQKTYKLSRPENAHNNNPHARKAVLEDKTPQHMAWAVENANGQRGFGCSGGHVHWNWGHDQFRKLFLNAIVWTAGLDVPAGGVSPGAVTVDDLLQNHDEPIPDDFNKARIAAMIAQWNSK